MAMDLLCQEMRDHCRDSSGVSPAIRNKEFRLVVLPNRARSHQEGARRVGAHTQDRIEDNQGCRQRGQDFWLSRQGKQGTGVKHARRATVGEQTILKGIGTREAISRSYQNRPAYMWDFADKWKMPRRTCERAPSLRRVFGLRHWRAERLYHSRLPMPELYMWVAGFFCTSKVPLCHDNSWVVRLIPERSILGSHHASTVSPFARQKHPQCENWKFFCVFPRLSVVNVAMSVQRSR